MIPPRILFKRILIGAVAALAVLYVGDYLSVRIRAVHPKPADPFESLNGLRILAIPEKNGKTEYLSIRHSLKRAFTRCFHTRVMPRVGI